MRPKFLLFTAVFGDANCGVFVKLKNSPRNCSRKASVRAKFLNTEKSQLLVVGLLMPGK